jgi:hypothetical protein
MIVLPVYFMVDFLTAVSIAMKVYLHGTLTTS